MFPSIKIKTRDTTSMSSSSKNPSFSDFKLEVSSSKNPIFLTSWPVKPEKVQEMSFDLYSSSTKSLFKKRRILVAENEKMEWVGENNMESNCR